MIIGISMGLETCQILGQVSLSLCYWKKNLQTEKCGPGRDRQNGKRHPGQTIYGQNSGRNYHEDHIAGKRKNHCNITIWYTNLFLCLKQ